MIRNMTALNSAIDPIAAQYRAMVSVSAAPDAFGAKANRIMSAIRGGRRTIRGIATMAKLGHPELELLIEAMIRAGRIVNTAKDRFEFPKAQEALNRMADRYDGPSAETDPA